MVVRWPRRAAVGLVALAIACGGESGDPPAESLDGREFVSETVEGRELVPDTEIRLGFNDGELGASAGCNSMFGPYSIEDGVLHVASVGSTEIGCDLPLHAQDEWLAGFLTSRPAVMLEEPRLTLTGSSERIVFLDREVASPDRPLVATNWECDAVGDGGSASSVGDADATIAFRADGEVRVFTSCETGTGTYSAGDTTITFASLSFDGAPCANPGFQSISEAFLFVFDGSPVAYEIDERQLVIRRAGTSLYFRSAE